MLMKHIIKSVADWERISKEEINPTDIISINQNLTLTPDLTPLHIGEGTLIGGADQQVVITIPEDRMEGFCTVQGGTVKQFNIEAAGKWNDREGVVIKTQLQGNYGRIEQIWIHPPADHQLIIPKSGGGVSGVGFGHSLHLSEIKHCVGDLTQIQTKGAGGLLGAGFRNTTLQGCRITIDEPLREAGGLVGWNTGREQITIEGCRVHGSFHTMAGGLAMTLMTPFILKDNLVTGKLLHHQVGGMACTVQGSFGVGEIHSSQYRGTFPDQPTNEVGGLVGRTTGNAPIKIIQSLVLHLPTTLPQPTTGCLVGFGHPGNRVHIGECVRGGIDSPLVGTDSTFSEEGNDDYLNHSWTALTVTEYRNHPFGDVLTWWQDFSKTNPTPSRLICGGGEHMDIRPAFYSPQRLKVTHGKKLLFQYQDHLKIQWMEANKGGKTPPCYLTITTPIETRLYDLQHPSLPEVLDTSHKMMMLRKLPNLPDHLPRQQRKYGIPWRPTKSKRGYGFSYSFPEHNIQVEVARLGGSRPVVYILAPLEVLIQSTGILISPSE